MAAMTAMIAMTLAALILHQGESTVSEPEGVLTLSGTLSLYER